MFFFGPTSLSLMPWLGGVKSIDINSSTRIKNTFGDSRLHLILRTLGYYPHFRVEVRRLTRLNARGWDICNSRNLGSRSN